MTHRCYVAKKFAPATLEMIERANVIIDEYSEAGFSLTVRQLHYQFVTRMFYENTMRNYNQLSSVLSDARLAGLVSWEAIEDRGRSLMGLNHSKHPGQAIQRAKDGYRLDLWRDQPVRPEVWVEKQALEGVLAGICNELRVNFFATKGYNSQSEQWRAGMRFARYIQKGQRPIIFHLGDHDPSGIDMTRDNMERLSMFAGTPIQVVRLALNYSQVEHYKPPPNPAKMTDSRAADYVEKYGDESWELDALDPKVIQALISDAVGRIRNEEIWSRSLAQEAADIDTLDVMAEEMKRPGDDAEDADE